MPKRRGQEIPYQEQIAELQRQLKEAREGCKKRQDLLTTAYNKIETLEAGLRTALAWHDTYKNNYQKTAVLLAEATKAYRALEARHAKIQEVLDAIPSSEN